MSTKKILTSILLIIILLALSSCHVARFFYWNFADIRDYKKFPALEVKNQEPAFYFAEASYNRNFKTPKNHKEKNFEQFLKDTKTLAFLVIKNDTICYENYFKYYTKEHIHPSFSVSKVYVSALMGIAIDEGYIKNTQEPIIHYVNTFKDPRFGKITIEDLLNMRSGIKFSENYFNPFGDIAKFYYGNNVQRCVSKLKIKDVPNQHYEYVSANTEILSLIIEKATNKNLAEYLQEKIWQPLGMEYDASWNMDSKKQHTIKSYCCLNARTRDFAKFGRLYLNKGNWNGKQIISSNWIERSTSIINDSKDAAGYSYTYCWRVMEDGSYFAKGLLGQYIYMNPKKNIIIVRLAKKEGNDIKWPDYFEQLCEEL